MNAAEILLEQFSSGHSTDAGRPALIGFLIMLLVGGIALLVQALIDFRRERMALKHQAEPEEEQKKKAA